jgi:hypothetical protein
VFAPGNFAKERAKFVACADEAADTLPRSGTNRWAVSGQWLERAATAIARLRDTLNRSETIAATKKMEVMTKVISAWTDEGGGCEQAHPEVTAALAGKARRQRI